MGDSLEAGFQAILIGLQIAWEWDKGIRNVIVESDAMDVIHLLQFGSFEMLNVSNLPCHI
ncbi:Reverse transcriptase-like [Sesbania bispinosa]|nr:Reverse transcriptase-like [Sesbania bispinosa]